MFKSILVTISLISLISFSNSCKPSENKTPALKEKAAAIIDTTLASGMEKAIFAGGCFWKMDAAFQQLKGVSKVIVGYGGGTVANPSYEAVCADKTGHAESFEVFYDPKTISYDDLLNIFWFMHNPTELNREGNDEGTQYRSAIFYLNEQQKAAAESSMAKAQNNFDKKIVTEITPYSNFFPAEAYHQDYFNHHTQESYCAMVVAPKVHKFEEEYKGKLK